MTIRQNFTTAVIVFAIVGCAVLLADAAHAQQYIQGYVARDVAPVRNDPLIFGVAANKVCQIKNFLFAAVYVFASIAFVVNAIRALFTKFEMKLFIPVLGALFIVASADLFIAFVSDSAWYCPTLISGV